MTAKKAGKSNKPAAKTGKPKRKSAKVEAPAAGRRANDPLPKSGEPYRTLVESALDGIVIHVGDRVAFANRAAAALLGFAGPDALVGQPLASFVHPDDLASATERVRRVLAGEAVAYPVEVRYVRQDGTGLPVENTGALVSYKGKPAILSVIRDITEHKRTEEALRREQEFARTLLDNVADGVVACNAEGTLVLFNRAAREWHGMDALALPPEEWGAHYDLYGPDGITPLPTEAIPLVRAFRGETMREVGMTIVAKGQPPRQILAAGGPFLDVRHRLLGAVVVMRDITERKRAEEYLKDSNEKLRSLTEELLSSNEELEASKDELRAAERYSRNLLETSLDPLVTISAAGKITDVNAATERITGLSRERLIGTDFSDYFTEPGVARAGYLKALAQGQVIDYPLEFRHTSGALTDVLYDASVYRNEQGEVLGVFAAARDITDRKRAEQSLRESEARYRRIAEGLTDYQYTVRVEDGRAVETRQSPACASVTGYTPEEYAADPYLWIQMVVPEDRDRVREHARLVLAGEDVPVIEHRIVRRDGEVRWVSDTSILFQDAAGRLLSYDGVITDITERKRAEGEKAELEAQNRQLQKSESLGRMAGAIAHHFNNQLQAVMMNLEMAMNDPARKEGLVEYLTGAMAAANRAAEVSGLMLTYLGKTFGKREPLDLSDACSRSLPMLRAALPKDVTLEADLPSPGPAIRADAKQIQQVLANLVTNAWEAGGDERDAIRLTVKTVAAADIPAAHCLPIDWQPLEPAYACLEVVDHGSGIAAADIEKLFDPFYSTKFTGRGLGLAVVLGIVRSHGGAVTVESTPGSGSAFRVYLPVSG